MKVFIGWSGERSRAVALALREWIPYVIQAADPWMSEEDISKGSRWTAELAMGQASFAIICVTPENREAPWLAFEAGALYKALDKTEKAVCPFLLGLESTDLKGPLSLFQCVKAEKEETLRMVHALNQALGESVTNDRLDKQFEQWWPKLERDLRGVPADDKPKQRREVPEMVEEILELVRAEARESRAFANVRTDFATHFSRFLGNAPGLNPETVQALQQTLLRFTSPLENVPPFSRMHRVDGSIVMAWVRTLGQDMYRASFSDVQQGLDADVFVDCEGRLDKAQMQADFMVQQDYPHRCEEERCGNWIEWQTYRLRRR